MSEIHRKGEAWEQPNSNSGNRHVIGNAKYLLPILLLLLLLPINHASTALVHVSNAVVDIGQTQTINGIIIGDTATTYTYNFTIAAANAVSPIVGGYSGLYDPASTLGGFSNVIALKNSKYLTQTIGFTSTWGNANTITLDNGGGLTTTNINSLITADNYNGIRTILAIGGSTQSIASVNTICANSNAQNALIGNIISAMNGASVSGNTLPFNGILFDIEDNGAYWSGCGLQSNAAGTTNVLNMVTFIHKLATNITAQNANDTLGMYVDTGDGTNISFNYKALSTNGVNYFDDQDGHAINGQVYTLGQLSQFANVVGGRQKVNDEWCVEGNVGGSNGCDSVTNATTAIGNVIGWGFGYATFTNLFLSYGLNGTTIFNSIAANVIKNTIITHNAIGTNALTSNTFSFQIKQSDTSNSVQKAKLTATVGTNTLVSPYSSNFTVFPALLAPHPTPATNTLDNGQSITLTASPSGGTGSGNYLYQWYTSTTSSCSSLSLISGATSSTYAFSPTNNGLYCYVVEDSGAEDYANTSASAANIVVYPTLEAGAPIPSPGVSIDNGRGILLSSAVIGGTSPYSYNWFNAASCGGSVVGTSQDYAFNPASSTTTFSYNIIDSASTPTASGCSTATTITVNPALGLPSISPSTTNNVAPGTEIIFSTSIGATGTANYIYKWTISNSGSPGTIYNITTMASTSSTSNTFAFLANSLLLGESITANVQVEDSCYQCQEVINSTPSGVQTITSNFFITSFTISNTLADLGQSEVLSASLSGGTSTYTYNYLIYNSIKLCLNKVFSGLGTSNTYTYTANALCGTGTLTANLIATDSASNIAKASLSYTVNSVLAAGAITPASPSIDSGQTVNLNANPSGGSVPYTYKWYTSSTTTPSCSGTYLISGATAGVYSASPTTSNTYVYNATDNATTQVSVCSAPDTVSVSGPLGPPTINPTAAGNVAVGGKIVFSTALPGGTSPFTYHWIISNSVTHTILNSTSYTNVIASSNTFTFLANSLILGNTIVANVIVTDAVSATANSVPSGVQTIVSGSTPTYSFPSGLSIAYGSNEVITGTCSGSDQCSILIAGTTVATSSGTVNYNYIASGIGVFKIKFCDTTISLCTPDPYLTVYSNIYIRNTTVNPSFIAPTLSGLSSCGSNFLGGTCQGTDTISGTVTLNNNLFVFGNVIQNSGTLTSNGFIIVASATFNNIGGKIVTGNSTAYNYPSSCGGSGGGSNLGGGQTGGNTLVVGGAIANPGTNPGCPGATSANMLSWFNGAMQNYLSGAAGGGATSSNGARGAYGIYIQANQLLVGNIVSAAITPTTVNYGGGGGGLILLVNGAAGYTSGTTNDIGGNGGPSCGGACEGGNGNVIRLTYTTSAPLPVAEFEYYPVQYYNQSVPNVTYTVNKTYNGVKKTINTNVISFDNVPAANDLPGIYFYNITETNTISQSSVSILFNLSINMTDITSPLGEINPCDAITQYYPNCVEAPSFSTNPKKWYLQGDNPLNLYGSSNFISGPTNFDAWSNANLSFTPNVILNYIFTSFSANLVNNPQLQRKITQGPFNVILANTLMSSNRIIGNVTIFSQTSFNGVDTTLSILLSGLLNNYTLSNTILSATGNYFYYMQIPQSHFMNPNFTYQINASATTPLYYVSENTYCPITVNASSAGFYPIGLVDSNGSRYNFYVYTESGQVATGYIMQVLEQKGAGSVQVQSYKIPSTIPFVLALEATGQQYAYDILSSNCKTYYSKGSFAQPTSPTYITLNISNKAFVYNITQAKATCSIIATSNTFYTARCEGADPTNLAYAYKVNVFAVTSAVGSTQLSFNDTSIGSSFNTGNFLLPVGPSYNYVVYAYVYRNLDPVIPVGSGPLITAKAILVPSLFGLIAFLLMLTMILGGANTGKIIVMVTLVDAGMFIVALLGVNFPLPVAVIFIVLSILAIWVDRKQT